MRGGPASYAAQGERRSAGVSKSSSINLPNRFVDSCDHVCSGKESITKGECPGAQGSRFLDEGAKLRRLPLLPGEMISTTATTLAMPMTDRDAIRLRRIAIGFIPANQTRSRRRGGNR